MSGQPEFGQRPLVSVCIANYNGEHLLGDCIDSILAQDVPDPVEILVHDDASTDASLAVLAERYPDVRVIASEENVGYCRSNNRLAGRARGEFLLLLNNDAALRAGALAALVSAIDGMQGPCVLTLPQYDWTSGELVDRGVRFDLFHTPVANRGDDPGRLAYVQAACLFIRRQAWFQLGGFPEWMVSNAEDAYLCAVARLAGGTIRVVPASGYDHRQGTSFGGNRIDQGRLSTTYRRRYLSERNRACLILACTPGVFAWPLFMLQLLILAVEGAVVSLLKRDFKAWQSIYWRAIKDALGMLGEVRRARRSVQARRQISAWAYLRILSPVPHKLVLLFRHGMPGLS